MTITKDNMHQAIAALRQCAKENENKQTDTGAVRVTDLCNDVADFLEKEKTANVKLETVNHYCKLDKREFTTPEERSHVCQKGMFLDLIDTRLIETREYADPDDKSGNQIVVEAEMFIGVKKGIDIDKELAHEEY